MNKPEPQTDSDEDDDVGPGTNQTDNGIALQTITETMEHPGFTAEQLPELWQQVLEPDDYERVCAWNDGTDVMYRRCETYPQHTKIAAVLSGLRFGWRDADWVVTQGHNLLRQATPEQIREALTWEQQHPENPWSVSDHVLEWAAGEQITGPVIEQLEWQDWFQPWTTTPEDGNTDNDRWLHIREHIQQRLLGGDKDAWVVFHGIVEPGTRIGAVAELANSIEQLTAPGRNET